MKKLLFFFTSIFFISCSSFARVPLEECFDLYHNTKEEYKDISPVWSEIMLQSGYLKGIRFFGDFGSIEHPEFKPHPAFNVQRDTLKLNAPQDAISALLEYLFPSPNGQFFAINQRQNDPLGQLSKKENLPKVNKLIEAIRDYKNDKNLISFKEKVFEIVESARGKNDRSKKTAPQFNIIRDHFVDILIKATQFEDSDICKAKYSSNISMHALFAFALTSADHVDEIYTHFKWIFVDQLKTRTFNKENYEALIAEILKDKKFKQGINEDYLIRALLGQVLFEKTLPKPLTYVNTFYIHNKKRISYPNCGETSLLNFFYYVWGDRGIINPSYIDITEKKLSIKAHPVTKNNWEKLKAYFLKFETISSSLSRPAQEEWSNLMSNMNREGTDPSLKITYRQNVCNVQGIGLFNMLNVLEKIIPDDIFAMPFSCASQQENYQCAATKLTKLCYLFSRADSLLDWRVGDGKKITNKIIDVIFTINNEDRFEWVFKNGSFHLEPIKSEGIDWRQDCAWEKAPLLLKLWVRSDIQKFHYDIDEPREIYALNLLAPETAIIAINKIIAQKWVHLKSIIPQLVGKTLFVNDKFAQRALYTLMHFNKGIIDGVYYAEFDWKTYIKHFKEMEKRTVLRSAADLGCWDVLQQYSIEDNVEAQTHVIAAEKGFMPIVKWILDAKPEAQNDKDCYGHDLIEIALCGGNFEVFDYLLGNLKSPCDYKNSRRQSLLAMLAGSHYDTTIYIKQLVNLGISLKSYDYIVLINSYVHFNNAKYIMDKMIEFGLRIDGSGMVCHFIANNSTDLILYALEKNILSSDRKGLNGETQLHIAAKVGNLDLVRFFIEQKGFDVLVLDQQDNSVLHHAAQSGSLPLLQYLLNIKGLKADNLNKSGQNPLHLALGMSNSNIDAILEITKLLMSFGADINQVDNQGVTPFGAAFGKCNISLDLIRELMKLGGKFPEFELKNDDLLHDACRTNNIEIVRFLIEECNHPLDGYDQNGQTPLHVAVSSLNTKLVDYLLSKGANPIASCQKLKLNQFGAESQTPLHMLASSNCHYKKYDEEDWDDDEENEDEGDVDDKNKKFLLTNERKIKILETLLQSGSNVDEKDSYGRTLLLHLMPNIHDPETEEFFDMLCEKGADTAIQDSEGNNALHYMFNVSMGYCDSTQQFDCNSFLNKLKIEPNSRNAKGETPLFIAMKNFTIDPRFMNKINALIKFGADINAKDNGGHSILDYLPAHVLMQENTHVFLDQLLDEGIDKDTYDKFLSEMLEKSFLSKSFDVQSGKCELYHKSFQYLKSKGVHLLLKDKEGNTHFQKHFHGLSPEDLESLFKKVGFDISAIDEEGNTALHFANLYSPHLIKKMLELGANPNAQNNRGETPLFNILSFVVYQNNGVDLLKMFKEFGADLTLKDNEGQNIYTFFLNTALIFNEKSLSVLDWFLDNGFSVNQQSKNGQTILHILVQGCIENKIQ